MSDSTRPAVHNSPPASTYGQIVRASSIMGGAAAVTLLLGMVRVKFAALVTGTVGIGLLTSFGAYQSVVTALFGLGIQASAVRAIADAVSRDDTQAIARLALTTKRLSGITGSAALFVIAAASPLISQISFGTRAYAFDVSLLGLAALAANLAGANRAIIQGLRQIGRLARAEVIGTVVSTVGAVSLYSSIGVRGIAPAILLAAAVQWMLTAQFVRAAGVRATSLTLRETLGEGMPIVRLGFAFLWSALLASAVTYLTVVLVSQQIGLQAVGIYGAAFTLSGIFVNFVLSAMGADYYPRLAEAAQSKVAVNRIVNEQTEVGLLLALPGLLMTLATAPFLVRLAYSSEFMEAVQLLQLFMLGFLGRVVAWPLGFVMPAMGKGRLYFVTESLANLSHMVFLVVGLHLFGLLGVALAFFASCFFYVFIVFFAGRSLTRFVWSKDCLRLIAIGTTTLLATVATSSLLSGSLGLLIVAAIALASIPLCLRAVVSRLDANSRMLQAFRRAAFLRYVCGLR